MANLADSLGGYIAPRVLALGVAFVSYSTIYSGAFNAGYVGKFFSDIAQFGCYLDKRKAEEVRENEKKRSC